MLTPDREKEVVAASSNMVFVTGQAKPGKEDAINNVYQVYSLSLIIDPQTDVIQDLACTCAFEMTNNFLRSMICGKNFITDKDLIMSEVKTRFLAISQKTFMAAFKDAQNRYLMEFHGKRSAG